MATAAHARIGIVKQDKRRGRPNPQRSISITAGNRFLNPWGAERHWQDYRTPECFFRADVPVHGGHVQAEYAIMCDDDGEGGMLHLYAEDEDVFIDTNPTEILYDPESVRKMAEFVHALGDALEEISRCVREQLPELRQQGHAFREMFERLVEASEDRFGNGEEDE